MLLKKINFWYISSLLVTLLVAIPVSTVLLNSFASSSNYLVLLKNTFLLDAIYAPDGSILGKKKVGKKTLTLDKITKNYIIKLQNGKS